MAAWKLYSITKGSAIRYRRIYSTAVGMITSGTDSTRRNQGMMTSPSARTESPMATAIRIALSTAPLIRSLSPRPVKVAMTTVPPMAMPWEAPISMPTTGEQLPTAAMASVPAKRPMMATSAALNSCCRKPVAATGSANSRILSHNEPCSKSISFRMMRFVRSFPVS